MVKILLGLLLVGQMNPALLLKEIETQAQPPAQTQVVPADSPASQGANASTPPGAVQLLIVPTTQGSFQVMVGPAAGGSAPAVGAIVQPGAPTQAIATSQPAGATLVLPAEAVDHSTVDAIHFDVGKLISGEQKLTPVQLLQLGPWVQFATELVGTVVGFIPRLFVAIFLFFIFWVIYRAVRKIVTAAMHRAKVDESIRDMLVYILKWAILGFGLVIAGNQIGIQIAALLTGVSIIGLAIGFAAQETLANFIAGIVIFWDKPFRVGDWIVVDGVFGQVQRVTFRSSRMLNLDGEVVVFPNTFMLSNKLINNSTHPINRVSIPIGIAYKESIDKAREALLSVTTGDKRICQTPVPEVVVVACADSSVNLELRVWVADESLERKIVYEYLERGKKALDAAGIEIPFPHMQLFLEQTPAVAQLAGKILPPGR